MSLFIFNVFRTGEELTPPPLRQPKLTQWLRVLLRPIQWLSDLFNEDYLQGVNYDNYDNSTAYVIYDRVIWKDFGVYELRVNTSTGVLPTGSALSSTNWIKVLDNFVGLNDRVKFNGQIIVFEAAINKQFQITSAPFIYLEPITVGASQTFVTIFVPIAVYNTLAPNNTARTNRVREFAEKYTLGGLFIDVQTF